MSDAERPSPAEILIAGLRNAHAMERQAVAVLEAQTRRLQDYPEFEARVSRHIEESRVQAERLERALERCDAAPSTLKDVAMSAMGLGQSTAQLFADDAPVKALIADTMFEHFEIAAYRSLIEIARLAGREELRPDLELSLREEEAMAKWLEQNLEAVTRRYVTGTAYFEPADLKSPPAKPRPVPTADGQGARDDAAAPETPLRDLGEFTDAAPERADWPDGAETGTAEVETPPAMPRPTPTAPEPPGRVEQAAEPEAALRHLGDFTDAEPDRADWPDGTETGESRPKMG